MPEEFAFGWGRQGEEISSNPVPPLGLRIKRLVIDVVRCDPGRNESAPLDVVHLSNGIQNPRAVGGDVYWNNR